MKNAVPIPTIHLFPVLDRMLIDLLQSLTPEEWFKPTIAKKWLVKDIAAHLLDGNIRTLSLARDKHTLLPNNPINNYRELVDYLNELNATWVEAFRRTSPGMLTELLSSTGPAYHQYLATLEPYDDAIFSVAWAGETVSANWFHIAREYTEKFHHQQQIREAVGKPGLLTAELFYPFIDTFMRGLPHNYRNIDAATGTTVQITIDTEAGGHWYLSKETDHWSLQKAYKGTPASTLSIDPDTAWKVFTKGITPAMAKEKALITGDDALALAALNMIAVMA